MGELLGCYRPDKAKVVLKLRNKRERVKIEYLPAIR
jgi:hypothetical protein